MTSSSFTPGAHELLGFAQHIRGGARDERAAQMRNDAEGAAVVAAFGNLQIGVMARRELHALLGQEIEKRIMRGRGGAMHGLDDALILPAGR